jgi:molybdopterin-containing oxidoreductase family membrane subunit
MIDEERKERDEKILYEQVHKFTKKSLLLIIFFAAVAGAFGLGFLLQLRKGLVVTGLNVPVYWGVYLASFVYFVGLSKGGTLMSAVLRVTNTDWRRPITRLAEAITLFMIFLAMASLGIDLGRPDRGPINMYKFGRFQSPLLWDFTSLTTYFVVSAIFLYAALIPDLGHLRDKVKRGKKFYEVLALNFRGTRKQWHQYEKAMLLLSILIIPIVISVHTIVSLVFSLSTQPLWHETMFGPFFVAGAIFSGSSMIVVVMYLLRKYYHLEDYLTEKQFNNMGKIILVMAFIWTYFFIIENVMTWYGNEAPHMTVLRERVLGSSQPLWILMVVFNAIIPITLLTLKRTIKWTTVASFFVLIGMYLERYLIVVPTLLNPRLPLVEPRAYGMPTYVPTFGVEIMSIFGSFAIFGIFYFIFTKLVQIVPISEIWEEDKIALHTAGDEGTSELYSSSKSNDAKDKDLIRKLQYGVIIAILAAEMGVVVFVLNGLRNALTFTLVNTEILDWGSLSFALVANSLFLPLHLTIMYTMTKLGLTLIKEGDEVTR